MKKSEDKYVKVQIGRKFYIFWAITLVVIIAKMFLRDMSFDNLFSTKICHFPTPLSEISLAEEKGIVLGVKNIQLDEFKYPYNGSIIEKGDGNYWLVFRHDIISNEHIFKPFTSVVGLVELDSSFEQKKPVRILNMGSSFSEDPRIFKAGKDFFLLFNDKYNDLENYRIMKLASLNMHNASLNYVTNLDQQISRMEKNWGAFEYVHDQKPKICLAYGVNPHKVMEMRDPRDNELVSILAQDPAFSELKWEQKWGKIRGGTPARLIGDEYLAFFHSAYKCPRTNKFWYVMGAYTFESNPPFRITSISKEPILFQGIYQTPIKFTADERKFVIFPAGIAFCKKEDREIIYLSCGENDCATKIVAMDKTALLKSLKKIDYSKRLCFYNK